MREQIKYNDRNIEIRAYSGSIERDLILYKFSRSEENPPKLNDLIFLVKNNIESNISLDKLSESEIIYILYSLRGISVSDSLPLNFDCPICKEKFTLNVNISDILKSSEINHPQLKNIYSENTDDYFVNAEELELSEYDKLLEYLEQNKTKFNFVKKVNCVSCGSEHLLDLKDLNILCSTFSSFDVMGFYNSIHSLIYYGKCSAYDLMNVILPFERELMTSYIQNEIEKQLQNSQNSQTHRKGF